jgi:hypothetical protein
MKNQPIKSLLWLFSFLIVVLLVGCNVLDSPPPTEVSPDAVYTIAAQTVIAHYTQEAEVPPMEEENMEESTIDSPSEPTQTLEPTPTEDPTQTQEPTGTPTLTETPTQESLPNTIMEDDFSNTSLWYVFDSDEYTIEYQDDSYRIYNTYLNGAIWSVKYQEYADIRIEVDATREAGPDDGYYGVICRFRDDGNDYYALVINDSGFYGILKMVDGEKEFLSTGIDSNGIINNGLGETNKIRGVCTDEKLILYANDQQLLELEDDSLTGGEVGLIAGNQFSDVGIDVVFDNFVLIWP